MFVKCLIKQDKLKNARQHLLETSEELQNVFTEYCAQQSERYEYIRGFDVKKKNAVLKTLSQQCNLVSLVANLFHTLGD